MLRFCRTPTDDTIAIVKGGPWHNRLIELVSDPVLPEYEEEEDFGSFGDFAEPTTSKAGKSAEYYEGLACPEGSEFMPMPCQKPEQRDVIYITGASGTGKSTFSSRFAELFNKVFKIDDINPKIIIVSPDNPENDAVFAGSSYDWQWISPEDILHDGITLEDMCDPDFRYTYEADSKGKLTRQQPMLIIFDDVEALSDKNEAKALHRFMQAVLERARKKQIYAAYISHRASAGPATKIILQEQNSIWFPLNGSGSGNLSYTLKKHLGIPDELRLALNKSSKEFGKWIFIKTDSCPRYAITSKKIFIINEDEIKQAKK